MNPNKRDDILERLLYHAANPGVACGHDTVTLSTANSTGLTVANIPDGVKYAIIQIEQVGGTGAARVIRYWVDGNAPTATDGILRGDADVLDLYGKENILNFRAIRLIAANHVLQVQYYK